MTAKTGKIREQSLNVWERGEPARRPSPPPLSRRAIVGAAVRIADEEGLASVSLRKVGAALNSGPMRLYGYVATKAELLDLMVDTVYVEMMAVGPFEGDWRTALSEIAGRLRQAANRHDWIVDLLGARSHHGPGALTFLEASHAALSGPQDFGGIDHAMKAVRLVFAYALGAIRIEIGEARAERKSGMTKAQWQFANSRYLLSAIGDGRFPTLARIMSEHTHPLANAHFDDGLEILLDGIAANLGVRAG
jgi:AcrR family transcriptional regulator